MDFQNIDFMDVEGLLTDEEKLARDTARSFVETQVIPHIEDHYMKGAFPQELVKPMAELGYLGANLEGYGCPGLNNLAYGLIMQELERGG